MKIRDSNRRLRRHRRIHESQIRDWEIGVECKVGKKALEHLLRTEKELTLFSPFPMIYSASQFCCLPLPSLSILLLLLQQGYCEILCLLTAWRYLGNRAHCFQSFLLSQPSAQWCSTAPHRPLDGRSRKLGRWWWAAVGLLDTSWIMLPINWVR